jgi:hypothetical protein
MVRDVVRQQIEGLEATVAESVIGRARAEIHSDIEEEVWPGNQLGTSSVSWDGCVMPGVIFPYSVTCQ